jgi:predicted phage terminase large subunit-like protein
MSEVKRIGPQPGPQVQFLSSSADIIIFGGAAGGGKSFSLLIEPLRHVTNNRRFYCVAFRRNAVQVRNPGGLWDASMNMYPQAGGIPIQQPMEWRWPKGGRVKFSHLENESSVLDWQGAEIPLILFDELTHFTKSQFFYMMSRNRSMSGVKGYIRASTNPDADSWVAELISWWIDQDTGFAIEERSGVVRWFIRIDDEIIWGNSYEELFEQYKNKSLPDEHYEQPQPKSLTFIVSKLTDNIALMKSDPSYMANLKAMSRVERARLLEGNWKIRPAAGLYFNRNEISIVEDAGDVVTWVRRWDLAATEPNEQNPNPDYTVGVLMGKRKNGKYVIKDVIRERFRAGKVRELVLRTAQNDTTKVRIGISQDPGQAGKDQAESYVLDLAGYVVETFRESGDKVTRAEPFAAQWQHGNVELVRGVWNEAFLSELEQFPTPKVHDDQVDAASGGFDMLKGVDKIAMWERLGRQG